MQKHLPSFEEIQKDGRKALRYMWYLILIFTIVQIIVSCVVASKNSSTAPLGYQSASFAAVWTMFLCIGFQVIGANIVFQPKSSELLVGFMIGFAFMMSELSLVLMGVFFVLGTEATTLNPGLSSSSSCLFLLLCITFACILNLRGYFGVGV